MVGDPVGTVSGFRRLVDVIKQQGDSAGACIGKLPGLGAQGGEVFCVPVRVVIKSGGDAAKYRYSRAAGLVTELSEPFDPGRIPWLSPADTVADIFFRGVEIGVHAKLVQYVKNPTAVVPVEQPSVISFDIAAKRCHGACPVGQSAMRSRVPVSAPARRRSRSSCATATHPAVWVVCGSRRCRKMALPRPATGGSSL